MSSTLPLEQVAKELATVLDEAFEHHHGIFLDKGTSLLPSIEKLDAAGASRAVSNNSGSIAAHVDHLRFHIEVLEASMRREAPEDVDWNEIWRTIHEVTPDQWGQISWRWRDATQRVLDKIADPKRWGREVDLGGAVALVAHTAFHLGAIRQILKSGR